MQTGEGRLFESEEAVWTTSWHWVSQGSSNTSGWSCRRGSDYRRYRFRYRRRYADVDTQDEDRVAITDETSDVFRGDGAIVTEQKQIGDIPQNKNIKKCQVSSGLEENNNDTYGYWNRLFPVLVREQRVVKDRRIFGLNKPRHSRDDQAAAEDHGTIDISKVLQLFRHPDDAIVREALRRLHAT